MENNDPYEELEIYLKQINVSHTIFHFYFFVVYDIIDCAALAAAVALPTIKSKKSFKEYFRVFISNPLSYAKKN
jgi:hypothetical protein